MKSRRGLRRGFFQILCLLAGVFFCEASSWAQFAPQTACQNPSAPRTSIYHVNGVTTTLDEEAIRKFSAISRCETPNCAARVRSTYTRNAG